MKKFLSLIIIAGLVIIAACSKETNPRLPDGIETVPVPLLTLDSVADALIQDIADFHGKFSVGLYFNNNTKPKKMDIVATMNGNHRDVRLVQADITTFPGTVEVTGAQLAQLFGVAPEDIVTGDYFELRANVTTINGTVMPGFPAKAYTPGGDSLDVEPYGSDISNFPGTNLTITYRKVCPLDLDALLGDGNFTLDDPDFWEGSYDITLERVAGTDSLKLTGYAEDPSAVLYLIVDERTHTVSLPKQKYAPTLPPYHNPTAAGSGTIDACNGTITITVNNSVDEGSFDPATIVLSR